MTECYSCSTIYKVILSEDYEDEIPKFCPICGAETEIELEFDDMDL